MKSLYYGLLYAYILQNIAFINEHGEDGDITMVIKKKLMDIIDLMDENF